MQPDCKNKLRLSDSITSFWDVSKSENIYMDNVHNNRNCISHNSLSLAMHAKVSALANLEMKVQHSLSAAIMMNLHTR